MTEPMFTPEPPEPKRQECDECGREAVASDDQLRVRGWIVFDGMSITDKPLHVRICAFCRKAQHEDRDL